MSKIISWPKNFTFFTSKFSLSPFHFLKIEIFAGTLSLALALTTSWYSNHYSDILTFLIFISSLSNFHFLDIQIFAEPAMEVGELTQALLLVNSSVGEVGEAYNNNNNNDVVKYNNSLCEVCWYIMSTKSRILRSIATPGPRASIKAPTHLKRFVWLKIPNFCLKWNYIGKTFIPNSKFSKKELNGNYQIFLCDISLKSACFEICAYIQYWTNISSFLCPFFITRHLGIWGHMTHLE